MTDDVLEISLKSPRPNFLQLLAQPEMAIVRGGEGSGPYRAERRPDGSIRLVPAETDGEEGAVRRRRRCCFAARARASPWPGSARARPISSWAGRSATCRSRGRCALRPPSSASIRWPACSASPSSRPTEPSRGWRPARRSPWRSTARRWPPSWAVPGLAVRQSLLPPGIEGLAQVSAPAWIRDPLPARQARAAALLRESGDGGRLVVRVAMPGRLGYRLLFARLRRDWAAVGVEAVRVPAGRPRPIFGWSTRWRRPASPAGICAISPARRAGSATRPPTR